MSVNKELPFEPILVGGRSLADRLAQRTHPLVMATVDLVHRDVTFYRLLPDEALRNDVTTIVRRNLELFISMLRTGADLAPSCSPTSVNRLVNGRRNWFRSVRCCAHITWPQGCGGRRSANGRFRKTVLHLRAPDDS